jgi:adenosine kinase
MSSLEEKLQGCVLGIGNPLLDISAECPMTFIEKYELQLNNAILAEQKHMALYDELVTSFDVQYIAGGATQNSIRVAQWMFRTPGCTGYMGAVGDDANGKILADCCARDGVNVHYMKNPEVLIVLDILLFSIVMLS